LTSWKATNNGLTFPSNYSLASPTTQPSVLAQLGSSNSNITPTRCLLPLFRFMPFLLPFPPYGFFIQSFLVIFPNIFSILFRRQLLQDDSDPRGTPPTPYCCCCAPCMRRLSSFFDPIPDQRFDRRRFPPSFQKSLHLSSARALWLPTFECIFL